MKKIRDGYVFYDEDLLKNKRGNIDWEKSIGLTLRIMYDYEIYVLKIVGKDGEYIYLEYNNNIDKLLTMNIRKCAIGKIIGRVTREFKYNIGDVFKDSKRDFVIIDRRYKHRKHANNNSIINEKQYRYKCNKCNNEDWLIEYDLEGGHNCNVCCGRKALLGFNTIWDTDRWMCSLGLSKEVAKTHTKGSNDKVVVVCPNCNKKKEIKICNIYIHKSIGCSCSDKRSYPEKFMMSVLDQLGVEYETQYQPEYLNRLEEDGKWSQKKSDFYLPQYNLIIETDGGMNHEGGKVHGYSKKPLGYYIEVDRWKDEQHLLHGLKTIRINCFESNMEYISNNIINSELNKIFDLSKVDWIKCESFAIKTNLVKEVCLRWNSKEEWETTRHLTEYFGLSKHTIVRYLKKGTELGWCEYNPKEEMRKSGLKNIKNTPNNKNNTLND